MTKQELETPRAPAGLSKYCNEKRKKAESDTNERNKSHRRRGDGSIYQVYFTEIVPLALFSEVFYKNNVLIKPVLGNQQYDAEVIKWGRVIEKIEITKPHDGKELSDDLNLMADRGYGAAGSQTPLGTLKKLKSILEKTSRSKSKKNYSGAVLVFAISYDPPFPQLNEDSDIQKVMTEYVQVLKRYKYNARKVIMFDMNSKQTYSIQRGSAIHWLIGLFICK